jgi:gamma-glutamyltranspeptidase / glutathione hydrolase
MTVVHRAWGRTALLVATCHALGCGDPAPQHPTGSVAFAAASAATHSAPIASSDPSASASAAASTASPPEVPPVPPPNPPLTLSYGGKSAVASKRGLVVSVDANATRAGVKVLEAGGNAVDAAVAVGYALAVTHPSAGNLGGGGFMIVRTKDGASTAIDFREMAPTAATTEKVVKEVEAGGGGYASTAVPGTVAGLDLARERFGTKPLSELLQPAVTLAEKGHSISGRAASSLATNWTKLERDPAAAAVWGARKKAKKAGDKVVQKDLAKTLKLIAERGDAGFYEGAVADQIAAAMKKNGGDVTKDDLAAYRAKIRAPLKFTYRGFTIETMPPPSMGGVAVAETLLAFERAHPDPSARLEEPARVHLFVESAKWAYADRRSVGADPDFFPEGEPSATIGRLLGGHNLTTRTPKLDPARATPAAAFTAGGSSKESPETTHFSVVDADGNAVSCTVTLSAAFGSKVMIPGTGVFFSNALGAFTPSGPNEVKPHKRMASSMSPTIASRNGQVQTLIALLDDRLTVDLAVKRPRVHHQLLPDVVRTETARALPTTTRDALGKLGHVLEPSMFPLGDAKVIVRDPKTGEVWGFSDEREGGLAAGPKK